MSLFDGDGDGDEDRENRGERATQSAGSSRWGIIEQRSVLIEFVSWFLSSGNLPDDVGAHQAIELADGREELFG